MPDIIPKKILIFQQRGWGKGLGRVLAKELYNQGHRLAAFTFKESTHDLILRQKDVQYDLIINHDLFFNDPKKFLAGENISLKEICSELGIDSVWPLLSPARRCVRSYKDKYYFSFRQNMSDEMLVNYIKASFKCMKIFFKQFNPDIIISFNYVIMPHLMFSLYAQKKGVKMLSFLESKVQGMNICSYDYQITSGPFFKQFDALQKGEIESPNREKAKQYIAEFKNNFKKIYSVNFFPQKTFYQKIKAEILPYREILRWLLTGNRMNRLENIGPTPDYRPPRIILRDHYCFKKYKRFMEKFPYESFEKIKDFVYLPLQVQPEESIDARASFFNNQIELARQTAMSLPDDFTLVVKEHPKMLGRRTSSYLEKIARTPNVKLVDFRIPTEEILKRARLIVSPAGTTGVEAAFLENPKPVIQFGDMGLTLKLPNVFKHTDMTTLSAKIKQVLAVNLQTPEYQRTLENYVAAVFDVGIFVDRRKRWAEETIKAFCQGFQKEIERAFKNNQND